MNGPSPLPPPRPLATGFDAVVLGLVGWAKRLPRHLRAIQDQVTLACHQLDGLVALSEADLQARLQTHRENFRRAVSDPAELTAAAATLAEAARRSLGLRPYPVQLAGAIALHRGHLAEMATGEGKTLTAGLAAVLAAWNGRPCHVVTANDYLAARDAEIMTPFFAYCGVTVAAITGDLASEARRPRYGADVVYVTAKELLGDFLRDRLATRQGVDARHLQLHRWLGQDADGAAQILLRGLHTAIVDEADSVLIDEAVTPLILSAPRASQGTSEAVLAASAVAESLTEGDDYRVLPRRRLIRLESSARERMAAVAETLVPLWRAPARREELLRQALTARHFFKRDKSYVIQEGKIVLLDEYTGRMTPNRTLSAGLHQAIEAHEGLEISDLTETLTQMSFQAFFRQFRRLSGMTGTGRESVREFWRISGLAGIAIPTHRPGRRRVAPARVHSGDAAKWQAIVAEIAALHDRGQPVLIGTRSVHTSAALAERLLQHGLAFELLNAVHHQDEARIIEAAGQIGRITIATNMAGRGTDIKLGPGAAELGGLHVILCEAHDSGRIDRQLLGRCGRQGDPGSASIHLSLEDELVTRFLPRPTHKILSALHGRGLPGASLLVRRAFRRAQGHAEHQAFQRRRAVLEADRWLENALPFGEGG